jgi:glycine/D-amino acid oxidase-like deaminating enzyme
VIHRLICSNLSQIAVADKEKKILIIGAGIAGSTLAMELDAHGHSVTLFDNQFEHSSSRVAAGLLNPIVPKGVRKTWQCHNIFPHVFDYYQGWANTLNADFIHKYRFLNIHANPNETSEWNKRMMDTENADWLSTANLGGHELLQPHTSATWVHQCGRLNVSLFLDSVKTYFQDKNRFIQGDFNHKALVINDSSFNYPVNAPSESNNSFDCIVFCEGIGILNNPYFNHLFFDPTGGDILTVYIPELKDQQCIIKQKQWLLPAGEPHTYLLGSNFHKNNLSTDPMESDAAYLLQRAREITQCEVTLIKHQRGVRPTVQNRRPYLGSHSEHKNMYVFNGLGAKGSSLCSWLSPMMANHIHSQGALNEEVDISRFNATIDPK